MDLHSNAPLAAVLLILTVVAALPLNAGAVDQFVLDAPLSGVGADPGASVAPDSGTSCESIVLACTFSCVAGETLTVSVTGFGTGRATCGGAEAKCFAGVDNGFTCSATSPKKVDFSSNAGQCTADSLAFLALVVSCQSV